MKRIKSTLLIIALLQIFSFQLSAQKKFELNDMDKLYTLTDPQISPDGKSVLVVVSKPDTATNKNKSFIYKVDVESGAAQQLTFERTLVNYPRWSPSGNAIAFIAADVTAKAQIFLLSMNGGEAKKITNSLSGVTQFEWSPNGTAFAFVQQDEVPNKKMIEKGYDGFEIKYNSMFMNARPTPSHLWLIPTDSGEAKKLTSGNWTVPAGAPNSFSWSPDGKNIILQSNESPYSGELIFTIKTVDIATGKITRITSSQIAPDAMHKERQPLFSPDGKSIAYQLNLKNAGYAYDIFVASATGGNGMNVTAKLDRCFFRSVWSIDSKALFVAANDFNNVSLWMQPISGAAKKLHLNNISITGAYWYNYNVGKNNCIAMIASTPQSPQELYFMANPESAPKQLTNFHEEMKLVQLGKVETFSWKSDEFTPNGILTFPPDFDPAKKYPLVLEIHGGPRSTSKEFFNSSAQLKAAHEYIVFQPNYRGSDNMGYRFSESINGDAGEGPGRDVMKGLAELKKRKYIDTTKIAVTGWSYGGFMTTWLIGNYQGWKCAIAGAAVTDWLAQYSQNDVGSMSRFEVSKGISPFTDKKVKANWIKNSPITYVENVKTPTLILSNTGDERVPISQSYTYFRALQDNGKESKFIAFPITGHIPTDPIRTKEMNRYILDWLDKYLK
ncbi:S9 family peptidase [Ferruginibacter sp.]|nr:S9 family peptidase [Ferruginibacter sp.]